MKFWIQPTPAANPDFDQRWHMCFRKVVYSNNREGTQAAKKMTKRFKQQYRCYPCPVCGLWHITKRPAL